MALSNIGIPALYMIPIETVTITRINIIPIAGDTPLSLSVKLLPSFAIINPDKVIHTLVYNILLQQRTVIKQLTTTYRQKICIIYDIITVQQSADTAYPFAQGHDQHP